MDGEPLIVRPDLVLPADELSFEVSRSGGPGGQNVNKVATRVTLRWSVADSRVLDDVRRARPRGSAPGRAAARRAARAQEAPGQQAHARQPRAASRRQAQAL